MVVRLANVEVFNSKFITSTQKTNFETLKVGEKGDISEQPQPFFRNLKIVDKNESHKIEMM